MEREKEGESEAPSPHKTSPARRGYMRATREEGIGDEIATMNAEARGTPFFAEVERPKVSASKPPLDERLARLTKKP